MSNIRKILGLAAVVALALGSLAAAETTLTGAGATFPYPIYSKWFDEYHKVNPDAKINYQSIGSGGGIRQVMAKTVDFGATDGPMSDKKISQVKGKIYHIPTVLGAVVVTFNVPGVDELNLSGKTLAGIYLGKIKSWDDPAIAADNPGKTFPSNQIIVVHRSEGSGTTYSFTDYLSTISKQWKSEVGKGKSVNWPVGLGGKGNEGVAGLIKTTKNSIGYMNSNYAEENHIMQAALKNKDGHYVKGTVANITAAAEGAAASMPKDYRVSIVNSPGKNAYPISTFTWLLVYQNNPGKKGEILKEFLTWMLNDGQKMAPGLLYAPLPKNVNAMVKKTVKSIR